MSARAELSSITTALDEITRRLDGMLDALSGVERDNLATDLIEVERALNTARRRLSKLVDASA
jgi:hypothetical protein